jgi:hypothetical protein
MYCTVVRRVLVEPASASIVGTDATEHCEKMYDVKLAQVPTDEMKVCRYNVQGV